MKSAPPRLPRWYIAWFASLILGLIPASAAERVAFVMGVDRYEHLSPQAQLQVAVRDATRMADTLRALDPPFKVTLVTETDWKTAQERFDAFLDQAKGAECALVYFAGHGIEYHGANYLLLRDTKLDDISPDVERMKRRMATAAVSLQDWVDSLDATRAQVKLVILDCCRDNPLQAADPTGKRAVVGSPSGLAQMTPPSGSLISYSADAGQQANDGLFTEVLIKHLKDSRLSILKVFAATREEVVATSEEWAAADATLPADRRRVRHEPAEYSKLNLAGTDFVFHRGVTSVPPPGDSPSGTPPTMRPGGTVLPGPSPLSAAAGGTPRGATKENPFVNSLGMKFVPVVKYQDGTLVHFCIWETRVQDYAAFAAKNAGVDQAWKDSEYEGQKQGPDHPVVNISHDDAKAFCAWLTQTERAAGRIGPRDEYRLPTDVEWSYAVGIGDQEDAQATPEEKDDKLGAVYPWGTAWPPPSGAGNFSGQESASPFKLDDYRDQHSFTAPVGSYAANEKGIFDLSGNVWEWCEDWYNPAKKESRVVRGASWRDSAEVDLRSSYRLNVRPANRGVDGGFRVVVAVGVGG